MATTQFPTPAMSPAERLRRAARFAPETPQAFAPPQAVHPLAPPVVAGSVAKPIQFLQAQRLPVSLNPDAAPAPAANPLETARRRNLIPQSAPVASVAAVPLPVAVAPAVASTVATPAAPSVKQVQLSALARLRKSIAEAPATGLDFPTAHDGSDGDERSGSTSSVQQYVRPDQASVPEEELSGRLVTVKEFNGWAVGTIHTEDRQEHRVKGESLVGLKEGLEYCLKGRSTTHSQYGDGFDVFSVTPIISANDQAIEHYLVKSFEGIGPVKAHKYVKGVRAEGGDESVDKLRATLLNEPWLLDLTKIAKGAKFSAGEDPQAEMKILMVTRNLMLRLGSLQGFRENTAKALAAHLVVEFQKGLPPPVKGAAPASLDIVGETWASLMRNPYAPIRKTDGYGFGMSEIVAKVAGIPRDSDLRLSALVVYAVEEGCKRKGHSFLSAGDFGEAIRKIDPTAPAQKALSAAIRDGAVVIDGQRVYSCVLLEAEKGLARNVAKLMRDTDPLTKRSARDVVARLDKEAAMINPAFKDGFDKDQSQAVASILTSGKRIHVLTGGPGTGKTAIVEAMLYLLKNKRFGFCAPTGKAAKVLTARVSRYGYRAVTANSLLKGGEEGGFMVNEEEPLDLDVLVADESTMTGIVMADALLSALPADAHLIILGDPGLPAIPGKADSARAGQLPSISPGRFMQDLLLVPGVNHVNLSKTYRNDGGILEVVKEIALSKLETRDRPSVKFSHGLPEPEIGFPAVMEEYLGKVEADGIENTLLVLPKRQGDRDTPGWNTTFANHILRGVCNPHGEKLPGTTLFLGDRIIIRQNMEISQPQGRELGMVTRDPNSSPLDFEKLNRNMALANAKKDDDFAVLPDKSTDEEERKERVVNGDTGTIISFSMSTNSKRLGSPQWIELALDDGRRLQYPGNELSYLQHAYALTIHSAQGSEYKNVIMIVTPGGADFMNQTMLFTGASRPQKTLSVHGDDSVIRRIAATPMPPRNSALVERIKAETAKALDEDAEATAPEDSVADF